MNQNIREDIFHSVEELFVKKVSGFKEIDRGFRNLKWIVYFDDHTSVFIKQYNQKRFDEEKLSHVKTALAIQDMAHRHGVCCSKVYEFDGQHLITSHQGQTFTVLEMMEGNVLPPGKASSAQMFSLGQALGKLHQSLSCISPSKLFWIPNKDR
ncbi:hypothetical protein [Laceyella tengchongensis]|uniref:hypothetical protein n=1 Tax=Laceyella tengchongensis TaxID=574699 RepID=UPI0012B74EDE|nr:hypothetical protein [Laceyella tengchongensis]